MSKYHAKKIKTSDGTFDSKREYSRWLKLKEQESKGELFDLRRQVTFTLIPPQKYEGGSERAVKYVADFVYFDKEGNRIVEDAKGMRTPDYIIKRKLMLKCFGIHIKEV